MRVSSPPNRPTRWPRRRRGRRRLPRRRCRRLRSSRRARLRRWSRQAEDLDFPGAAFHLLLDADHLSVAHVCKRSGPSRGLRPVPSRSRRRRPRCPRRPRRRREPRGPPRPLHLQQSSTHCLPFAPLTARTVAPASETTMRGGWSPFSSGSHLRTTMWPCGFWSSRTRSNGRAAQARPRGGGSLRRRGAQRRGRALDGRRDGVRRDRARRHAAGDRRLRGVPPSARGWSLGARSDAHCARRGRGPRPGSRRRRRRLPDQAVLVRGAACPSTRACSATSARASGGRRGRRPAARPRHPAGVARRRRDRVVGEGVRIARDVHAPPGRGSLAISSSSTAWDYGYENRSNVVDVYVRYLREKVDRPFGRSSLETVRGAGYRLRRE